MPRHLFVGFLALFLGLSSQAAERRSNFQCLLFEVALKKAKLLHLPPHSERYLIVAVMTMDDGDRYLAVQDYLGEHTALETAARVEAMGLRPHDNVDVTQFEVLGEVHLVNETDHPALGQAIEFMNTSGYGFRLRNDVSTRAMVANWRLEGFERVLTSVRPDLLHKNFRATPYTPTREHLVEMPGDVRHGFETKLNLLMESLVQRGRAATLGEPELNVVLRQAAWSLRFLKQQGHPVLEQDLGEPNVDSLKRLRQHRAELAETTSLLLLP